MANDLPTEYETQEKPEFSISEALEGVSRQGFAQTAALQEKQQEIRILQTILSDIEKRGEVAELELKSRVRQTLILEGEMEDQQRRMQVLGLRSSSIYSANTELRFRTEEAEENARVVLAGYNAYRNKMESHRAAVSHAESQTEAHRELMEKRGLVRTLTESREELRADLDNPRGKAVQQAQREIDDLRGKISVLRKTVAERRELLLEEFEKEAQIKRDIEIQNRRYEAIVKRLHCQLNKAQAVHRQVYGDIYHMRRQIEQLKKHLKSS